MAVVKRIIITGANGFVGTAVLRHCISNPHIQRIFAIVRKPLPPDLATNPKVHEVILDNFENWPQELLDQLGRQGVQGCIWCIGGAAPSFPDLHLARYVNVDLPTTAATAFAAYLAPDPSTLVTADPRSFVPFRFIYLSIAGAEGNNAASLWVQAETRKIKGAAEQALFDIGMQCEGEARGVGVEPGGPLSGVFEVFALRLGKVYPGGQTVGNVMAEAVRVSISVERVGAFCTQLMVHGRSPGQGKNEPGGVVVENAEVLGDDWAQVNSLTV